MDKEFTDTRQHILNTARAIILGKGFAAVGLNEILTSAGVPKGSFYHYFKSKEDFGNTLLQDYFDRYLARLEQALRPGAAPAGEQLLRFFSEWIDTQSCHDVEGKCVVVKLGAEVADLSDTMRITLQQGTSRVTAVLAACIGRGIREGSIAPALDAPKTAQVLYQMWLGATVLGKVHRTRQALEDALDATYALLGIRH
ncbi:MAG: TetR/AcrR family transcriptional regulator [Bacillota bacterium]